MLRDAQKLIQKAKNSIGYPVVLLEVNSNLESGALDQALAKYEEYFTAFRYSSLAVTPNQRVYDISSPAEYTTYTNEIIGTMPAGSAVADNLYVLHAPMVVGSVSVIVGTSTAIDSGTQELIGTGITGTVDYSQGLLSITMSNPVTVDTTIMVTYNILAEAEAEIIDVLKVTCLPQYYNTVWSQRGLLDVPGYIMSNYMLYSAEFYQLMRGLDDTGMLLGTELDFEYVKGRLYLRSFQNATVALEVQTTMTLADVQNEHMSRFMDILIGYLKIAIGHVRRKYPTVSVPGGEIQLDGDAFITEGQELITRAEEKFKEIHRVALVVQA